MRELFEEYAAYHTKQLIDRKTKEARIEERRATAQKMFDEGLANELIAKILNEPLATIKTWLSKK